MVENKVCICVDGVNATAVVDTGASVSVMSLSFKDRLGHKVVLSGMELNISMGLVVSLCG